MFRHFCRALLPASLLMGVGQPALGHSDMTEPAPSTVGRSLSHAFDPGTAGFTVTARGELDINYRVFTLFAQPGETIPLSSSCELRWAMPTGETVTGRSLRWTAPETPGLQTAIITTGDGQIMELNILVMHEAANGRVGDYRLGEYPGQAYRGNPVYNAPTHFAEVPENLRNLRISPHFTLGQFLCKQETEGNPYLIVSERLLAKLEIILAAVNAHGWRTDTFFVMSGYRTPAYNAAIGNGRYSRHIYGGAADIFIDTDGDGRMDDLNSDGLVTREDAAALYDVIESMWEDDEFGDLVGGLGEYGPNTVRGPFVHVDERGWRARWGR